MLSNISRRKGNQRLKLGHLIEYNERSVANKAGRLVSDPFLFFKKALHAVKASDLQLGFNIF